jgi:exonuclease SbcC
MRILRISLRNIASLAGDHRIDFTREPLRSAGLFSISWSHGLGQSTLLDALCLALYEKTPRLKAVSSGAVKLADGAGEITQSDPRNLLSRGTAEGSAEVAFIGVDGPPVHRALERPPRSQQTRWRTSGERTSCCCAATFRRARRA